MKKLLLALMLGFISSTTSFAFDYESARPLAWYLTDKMAYELDLTEEQCDYVYQINLNYFLQVTSPSDLYSRVATCRNEDLGYVLTATQYAAYLGRNYFEAPLTYTNYEWLFPVLEHYEQDAYFLSASVPTYYGNMQGNPRLRSYNEQSPYQNVRLSDSAGLRSGNMQRGFGHSGNGGSGFSNSSSDSRFNQNQGQGNTGTFGNNSPYNQQQNGGAGMHPNRFRNQGNSNGGNTTTRGSGNFSNSQNNGSGTLPNRFGGQTTSGNNGNLRNTNTNDSRFNSQGGSSSDFTRSTNGSNSSSTTGTLPNRFGGQTTGGNNGNSGNLKNSGSGNSRFKSGSTSTGNSSRSQSGSNSGTGSTQTTNRFKK